jgi:hypothetical protein
MPDEASLGGGRWIETFIAPLRNNFKGKLFTKRGCRERSLPVQDKPCALREQDQRGCRESSLPV